MLGFLQRESTMKIRANLPDDIHGFRYVTNSHFVEVEDENGNTAHLLPTGIVKYKCEGCDTEFFMGSNHGVVKCPVCGLQKAKPCWGKVQLSFVPEKESDFKSTIANK
jgi:DNA-directed RNA polymerase subunit RPC12/RpoP